MDKTADVPKTLVEALRYFSNPDVCLSFMVELRWPDGVVCPTCGGQEVSFLSTRRMWKCRETHARQQFSVKVGTIFEDSPIPLDKWLAAIWLIANAKNGISSYEVARALGVTQKTAWFMLHRIRLAMQTRSFKKLSGAVEVDETFIGAKARNMHKAKRARLVKGSGPFGSSKAAVLGFLQRSPKKGHSRVSLTMIDNIRTKTLDGQLRSRVRKGANVYTDALASYRKLSDQYRHEVIDHAREYARGAVHTNGLENFWSLLKRALKGTYVNVEPFHLFRYLDEQAYRFNTRIGTDATRFVGVLRSVVGRRLDFKTLTSKNLRPATT
ncbi:MAG: IS1595 family transposase [Candidatus Limnocylindria bacterium]